ncbi:hypothetical protein NQ318_017629 [Aromia moschata]|uniref:Uncharacterized protein n=1 Tax=Aromia moschata TaxID=1265417 RepID=A0AAV8Z1K3_9CUCU|nr:hypothetical protein NQ318_017629 [Aromia moschata]
MITHIQALEMLLKLEILRQEWNFVYGYKVIYLENPDFLQNILYTDEATFTTNGIVSSQNIRIWSENIHIGTHNAVIVRNWLNENFPNYWIGRSSPLIPWPQRSPDITPLDFFFGGTIKNKMYATRPQTREELSDRIRQACQIIIRQI